MKNRSPSPAAPSRHLIPALRRLALFSNKTVHIVSTELGVDVDELEKWVATHGRPTGDDIERWDDDMAGMKREPAEAAEEEEQPVTRLPVSLPSPATPAPTPAPAVEPAAAPRRKAKGRRESAERASTAQFRPDTVKLLVRVARLLINKPGLKESVACERAGLNGTEEQLKTFIAELTGEAPPPRQAESAEPEPPALLVNAGRPATKALELLGCAGRRAAPVLPLAAAGLHALCDRHAEDVDRLEKELAGVDFALRLARARREVAQEALELMSGAPAPQS